MTRREVWAWATLLSLLAIMLLIHMLLGVIEAGGPADERWLSELCFGVWVSGATVICSVCGWAWAASRRR